MSSALRETALYVSEHISFDESEYLLEEVADADDAEDKNERGGRIFTVAMSGETLQVYTCSAPEGGKEITESQSLTGLHMLGSRLLVELDYTRVNLLQEL